MLPPKRADQAAQGTQAAVGSMLAGGRQGLAKEGISKIMGAALGSKALELEDCEELKSVYFASGREAKVICDLGQNFLRGSAKRGGCRGCMKSGHKLILKSGETDQKRENQGRSSDLVLKTLSQLAPLAPWF